MKNYIQIGDKKIEISQETADNLSKQFLIKETPSDEVAMGSYEFMSSINWEKENNCDKRWFEIKDFISNQIEQAKREEREEIVKEIENKTHKIEPSSVYGRAWEGYNHALKEIQHLINKRQ